MILIIRIIIIILMIRTRTIILVVAVKVQWYFHSQLIILNVGDGCIVRPEWKRNLTHPINIISASEQHNITHPVKQAAITDKVH